MVIYHNSHMARAATVHATDLYPTIDWSIARLRRNKPLRIETNSTLQQQKLRMIKLEQSQTIRQKRRKMKEIPWVTHAWEGFTSPNP